MSRGDDGFVARWSRRKLEAEAPEEAPAPDPQAEQAAADAAAAEKTDAEILEELDLPDPDEMQPGDDFSAFMAKAVPTRLRNRALRRLWRSNPVLANLDQLNDYDGDFTDAATAGQVVQTAYRIGRGFADRAAALVGEEAPAESAAEGDPPPDAAEEAASEETETPRLADDAAASREDQPATLRKSMRFTFDDGAA